MLFFSRHGPVRNSLLCLLSASNIEWMGWLFCVLFFVVLGPSRMSASMRIKNVTFDRAMHESTSKPLAHKPRGKGHYLCEECDEEVMGNILKQALEKRSKLVKKRRGQVHSHMTAGFQMISSDVSY